MKRRHFIMLGGIGGAIAAVATGKLWTTSFEESAEKLIKKELTFLKLESEGIKTFVRDYGKTRSERDKLALKGYYLLGITASQSGRIHQLVSNYLLSTDFFSHQDESRVIKYTGLYDPYTRPCAHPFSHSNMQASL